MNEETSSSDSVSQVRVRPPEPFAFSQDDLKNAEIRLRTYTIYNWPLAAPRPEDLAFAGFYYFNLDDQVKCAFCGGIIGQWEVDDLPIQEHEKFFPNCPLIIQQQEQGQLSENNLIQNVVNITPKFPEFSTLESRIRSFATWNTREQNPNILAQSGFFFLGFSDEVRCFYCDGGLRNWLPTDDPWFEHARWFPKCPFVLLVKGPSYVRGVIRNSAENANNQSANESIPAPQAMTIDEAMSTQPVIDALAMGLNVGRIKSVVQRRINIIGRPFNDTETLVSAVLDGQIEDEGFESPESNRRLESQVANIILSAVSSVVNSEESAPSTSSAVPETRTDDHLENRTQIYPTPVPQTESFDESGVRMRNVECKICMQEEVGVVFLPCGHLLSCVMCAPAIANCPLCRQKITNRVRTFLS